MGTGRLTSAFSVKICWNPLNCFLFRSPKNFSGTFLTSSGDTESTMDVILARFETLFSSLLAIENISMEVGVAE